jgi:lipoprotein-anchoring transpeptidase ErfK/SrfK
VKSYSVAVGTAKDPTPRGRYSIRKLVWNPGWVPPDEDWAKKKTAKAPGEKGNPMKVVKIFFREPDYYIHGTGETKSLGSAASHGCLRMAPSEAAELGQYIMEHGGQPRDESWFRRIFRFRSQTKVVYLRSPVSMTITD